MRKLTGFFALLAVVAVAGCAHSASSNLGPAHSGYYTRAHGWEKPHFTADLKSNPVKSELGMGFVTVGSHVGWSDQEEWASLNCSIGPANATE